VSFFSHEGNWALYCLKDFKLGFPNDVIALLSTIVLVQFAVKINNNKIICGSRSEEGTKIKHKTVTRVGMSIYAFRD
jgi:hypothetical protein